MATWDLLACLGAPDGQRHLSSGELELHYGLTIYRCEFGRFVECTFPDSGPLEIAGVTVLTPFEWLAAQPGVIDRAGFRVVAELGLAYDRRDPAHGSLTVFERHRWDPLLSA